MNATDTLPDDPTACEALATKFLQAGEPLAAYDAAQVGLRRPGGASVRLRQLRALALARSGVPERANRELTQLVEEGHTDGETLGMLARTHKDLAECAAAAAPREEHLARAFVLYQRAFADARRDARLDDAVYAGADAATLARLAGRETEARDLAGQVSACSAEVLRLRPADYWAAASLGEMALVRGDLDDAAAWYGRAAATGHGRHGHIASTRRNARLLLAASGVTDDRLDTWLPGPAVAILAPSDASATGATVWWRDVAARLRRSGGCVAFGAALTAADLDLMETALDAGCELHVVLPCPPEALPGPEAGAARWRRVLQAAAGITTAVARRHTVTPAVARYTRALARGFGLLRRQMLDGTLVPFPASNAEPPSNAPVAPPAAGFTETVAAMVFADVADYGSLSDEQIPLFIERFMGTAATLAARMPPGPAMVNTWGDALFMVFARVGDAGRFALALSEALERAAPPAGGALLPDLSVRIALDAGSVYRFTDPLTRRENYTGVNVTRAARLEPVTPPGQVYATGAFAALAAVEGADGLRCDYVGRMAMAKSYGTCPVYHVTRC